MFKNVKYLLTTHDINEMPQDDLPEVVIVGRSNVGKSTFINLLTNNSKLAKTSSQPGKTRALSLFLVDNKFRIVDIPGYGHARVSQAQKKLFSQMIDSYLSERPNIAKAIILLDTRRGMMKPDQEMIDYFMSAKIPFIVVGTKLDKVNQSEYIKFNRSIFNSLNSTPISYSAVTKKNLDQIKNIFLEYYE